MHACVQGCATTYVATLGRGELCQRLALGATLLPAARGICCLRSSFSGPAGAAGLVLLARRPAAYAGLAVQQLRAGLLHACGMLGSNVGSSCMVIIMLATPWKLSAIGTQPRLKSSVCHAHVIANIEDTCTHGKPLLASSCSLPRPEIASGKCTRRSVQCSRSLLWPDKLEGRPPRWRLLNSALETVLHL